MRLMTRNKVFQASTILWVLFFCYTVFAAIIFQKMLLPLFPGLHAGQGVMSNDAQVFHQTALVLADQIREQGWSRWAIWPSASSGGNVAVLAALYVFFKPDPTLIIPVNAILHASGALLIFLMGCKLWSGRPGFYGGIVAALLFIVYPSSLNWYGQIHKDGYSILGILLTLYTWVVWKSGQQGIRASVWLFIWSVIGSGLIAFVRPHYLPLLGAQLAIVWVLLLVHILWKRGSVLRHLTGLLGIAAVLIVFQVVSLWISNAEVRVVSSWVSESDIKKQTLPSARIDERVDNLSFKIKHGKQYCPYARTWQWKDSLLLPGLFDNALKKMSTLRMISACTAYTARSTLDQDLVPDDAISMIQYMPRALQITLWGPFPNTWFKQLSITRLVGWLEIIGWYLLAPGVVMLLWYRRSPAIIMVLIFTIGFLTVYSYVTPNLGTLHRLRYPFILLLMLLGAIGWFRVALGYFHLRRSARVKDAA